MTQPEPDRDAVAYNQNSLQTLLRAIDLSQGQFSLILVRCNYEALREILVRQLRERCPFEMREIALNKSVRSLSHRLLSEPFRELAQVFMVFGLESVSPLDRVLASANLIRDALPKNFPLPILLWVSDEAIKKLIRLAPDLESWSTSVHFSLPTEDLTDSLRQKTERIFAAVLETDPGKFLANITLLGERGNREFQSALKDLECRHVRLEPELDAGVKFVLGRDAYARDSLDIALKNYQQSLAFWKRSSLPPEPRLEAQPQVGAGLLTSELRRDILGEPAPTSAIERQGAVLFHIGLCHRRNADRKAAENRHSCERAWAYFQESVEVFEKAQRADLAAKFISPLCEILLRLQEWEALQTVADKSVRLHQTYGSFLRLAQDWGFFARIAVERSRWSDARQWAALALQTLSAASEKAGYPELYPSLWEQIFRLCLVKAQRHLGQRPEALKSLHEATRNMKNALAETDSRYDPQRYIRFLRILRSMYFEEGDYKAAFWIKQQQRSVEQQYGFRAFIGAGRLQAQQPALNPALGKFDRQGTVSREIEASGRQQDVSRLQQRIASSQHKLTVIYGPSGAGKSSTVTAGLVPALQQTTIRTRDVLPAVLQIYTDWASRLGRRLSEELQEARGVRLSRTPEDPAAILELLRENAGRNLLTVLIFDQFEEFFSACKPPAERLEFYEFFRDCLNSPFVKVILSMRQDYLHYLLECSRAVDLDAIDSDILNKDILYYLGNFSPAQARSAIQSLTERSQFHLEPQLLDRLVRDLAGGTEEVRPIELQVVGAQLQAKNITTLAEYEVKGPKEKLVADYLEEVVRDCGPENESAARLVLYFLTDEDEVRPLKSYDQLAAELALDADKLDLVLEILVQSGLVFLLKDYSADFYQLIHDYLAALIRQYREPRLQAELRLTKEQLRQALHKEQQQRARAEIAEIEALTALSHVLLLSHDGLGALVAGVKAGSRLIIAQTTEDVKQRTVNLLQKTLSEIRERNRLQGHQNWVTEVSTSPDGQTIATASADGTVRLWRRDGTPLLTFREHAQWVNSVAFSPTGTVLASGSWDKTVKLWQPDGTVLAAIDTGDRIFGVCFSPNGQLVATAGGDGTVKLWRVAQIEETGCSEGTPVLLKVLDDGSSWVTAVAFSPDGQIIATAGGDGTVKLWDLQGALLAAIAGHSDRVWKVAFSPDGQIIATASADSTAKLWLRDGCRLLATLSHAGWAASISFSPDGQTVATGSWDRTVKLWQLDGTLLETLSGHTDSVNSVCFSPGGEMLLSAGADATVRLWQLDRRCQRSISAGSGRVMGVCFSPDQRMLATAGFDKTVRLWHRDGTLLGVLEGHSDWVKRACFSPDGEILATASADGTVKLWRTDGTLLNTFGNGDWMTSVKFSPDGQILAASGANATVKLWRTDGTLLGSLSGHADKVWDVCFSPDGEMLATASWDGTIKLWNLEGKELVSWRGDSDKIFSVSFSPDGSMLASAGGDKTVKLWRTDGSLLLCLQGHTDMVLSVSFSPKGDILASGSADKTVKLWRTDGTQLLSLRGHRDMVSQVSFSGDGSTLASAGADGTVKLWSPEVTEPQALDLDQLLVRGCDWLRDFLRTNPTVSESDRALAVGS
ncbi:WD40 repeat domain-containing protein [Kamptonema formosum]|uniref:WD40 repeat domain-containing protein n=1 Tax=Kamptonema formosum TaxID=331992 RepID=UPI00034A77D5|nr:WD40 repeat domain-containing protein [Oscillatoria sp. PCC 10802]